MYINEFDATLKINYSHMSVIEKNLHLYSFHYVFFLRAPAAPLTITIICPEFLILSRQRNKRRVFVEFRFAYFLN